MTVHVGAEPVVRTGVTVASEARESTVRLTAHHDDLGNTREHRKNSSCTAEDVTDPNQSWANPPDVPSAPPRPLDPVQLRLVFRNLPQIFERQRSLDRR